MKILLEKIQYIVAVAALLLVGGVQASFAFSTDYYAENSRLAQGRWVKISVSQSGMYLLTEQQLRQWGFTDPSQVKVYGYGALRQPDRLNNDFLDDLPQTPSEYISGQGIVFFGEGPTTITNYTTDYFRPVQNPFTLLGYYFLSATDDERNVPQSDSLSKNDAPNPATSFRDLAFHELEETSPGYAGYQLVGESFKYNTSQSFKIDLPGIDTSKSVKMEASFVAKSASSVSTVTYSVNGTTLAVTSGDTMQPSTDGEVHAVEGLSHKEFNVTSSPVTIGVRYSCAANISLANLNYIALTYTRSLDLSQGNLIFFGENCSDGFAIKSADSDTRVWDITTPMAATAMNLSQPNSGASTWSLQRSGTRRFAAWKPSSTFLQATLVGDVANQNLHALPATEMIIFTMPQWKEQAERLANLHRNSTTDPIQVTVLTPQEIYNEFSSGVPDVQSFRKLLKMFYDRQLNTDMPLRFALFLSRPICDMRQLSSGVKALGYSFMPAWFTDSGLKDIDSYSTDDMFGFLDDYSGTSTSSDKLRIAVGRIPATSVSDVKLAVDKIESYQTKMPVSNWKNNIVVTADDEDASIFMQHAEWFCNYINKSNGGAEGFLKKVYIDQYERTSSVCEEARSVFYRYLDEGAMLWVYVGHASTTTMTAEGLVSYTDLNNMYLRHWPILYAATCNLLRWDGMDASGAELMYFNSNGGVISAISATRAVYIPNNGNLTASFGRHFLERDDNGKFYTIGEIYQHTKNDYRNETSKVPSVIADANKLRYVLMGDPAMRYIMPSSKVVIDRIADKAVPVADTEEPPCLMARQQTTMEGYIQNPDGSAMSDFNGNVVATLYDAEDTYTTQGYGTGTQENFDKQGDRLAVGNAKVENGRFTMTINMPSEVANNYRPAAISLYAYEDSGRDAIGVNRDFYVYGTDPNAAEDNVPPTIKTFYLNHPTFTSGDEVNDSPMVIAEITDDVAINLSTAGIGHMMSLSLDNGSKTYSDVAEYYTPNTDGTAGGTIYYPLEDLAVGNHTLRLRVWDTAPNSAEASLDFYVAKQITPTIYDVYTDCNPASTEANFYISHDRPDQSITVTIEVFDMMGRRLWKSTQSGRSDMFTSLPITWDLTDYGGHRVGRGIYLYRATVSDDNSGNKTATAARRLAVTAE
jgi:hypothetical protein